MTTITKRAPGFVRSPPKACRRAHVLEVLSYRIRVRWFQDNVARTPWVNTDPRRGADLVRIGDRSEHPMRFEVDNGSP